MKTIFFLTLLLTSLTTFSQTLSLDTGETYAVVVGISDYQDPQIPDLRFADKDALAFAGFLQSPAGGSLDEDHLKVLVNEKATAAKFAIALDWLWEVASENDRAIIYFSGHGDVEKKSITQPGYLLCWDAPAQVYMAGGAFDVRVLNDVVSTLSVQNKSKVLLVTDACRAGKLSGSGINGSQATASHLAKQFANEIKILSCQPDEYSIEGEQWGGGRGAFSYHLLDGLTGLADGNGDQSVNLMEIGRYLEDNVTTEVAPHSQIPMTIGSRGEKLTTVFPELIEQLKEGKQGQMELFTSTASRGMEDNVLAAADSSIVEMYLAYKKAIEQKRFLCNNKKGSTCADDYYAVLSQERQLEQLHSTMRRNYAAALQDDAQQVINRLLKSNPDEYERSGYYISRNYKNYPKYLKRAAELLGPDHYMYNILKARESWFKGYIDRRKIKCNCPNQKVGKKSISLYKKALRLQPNMPTAYWEMAAAFANQLLQPDSAEHYAEKALEQNPNWTMIHAEMAHFYVDKNKFKKAHEWIDRGLAIDGTSITLLYELTWIYNKQLDYEKEVAVLDQILTRDTFASTLAFKGDALRKMGQFAESEQVLLEALARDSLHTNANDWLLNLYTFTSQFDKEEAHLEKMLRRFPKDDWYKSRLVRFRAYRGDYEGAVAASAHNRKNTPNYRAVGRNFQRYGNRELAEKAFTKCIETYPKSVAKHVEIGIGYTREEEWETALVYLLVACGLDSTNYYAHNQTAQAFVGAKQYDDALEYFDKALTINPDAHLVLLHKGAVQMHLKDYDAAEATLKKAEKLNSKWNSLKYATLGLLFYLTDRSEQAESTVKKAFKTLRDRDLRDIFIHTARYFSMFEKYEEGEQALLFLYKIAGPNEFADFELAQLMAKGGDYDKAYRYLRSAIDNYYSDFYQIRGTKYFRPMMEDKKRWHREMGAYFPDLSK